MHHNTRSYAMVILVLLAPACGKKEQTRQSDTTAASDSAASAPVVASYRAFGNEPFWSVFINADGLRFISPEDTTGVRFPPVEAVAAGDTLRWTARSDHGSIVVRIWPGACSDGMSDRSYALSSHVQLNETAYLGCAEQVIGSPTR